MDKQETRETPMGDRQGHTPKGCPVSQVRNAIDCRKEARDD